MTTRELSALALQGICRLADRLAAMRQIGKLKSRIGLTILERSSASSLKNRCG
jgi:hypothetical protein